MHHGLLLKWLLSFTFLPSPDADAFGLNLLHCWIPGAGYKYTVLRFFPMNLYVLSYYIYFPSFISHETDVVGLFYA